MRLSVAPTACSPYGTAAGEVAMDRRFIAHICVIAGPVAAGSFTSK
jgi:hypothetical protein